MADIGALVERLVEHGFSIGEASSIIAEAVAAGATAAAYRRSPGALRQERYRKRNKPSQSDASVTANESVTKRNEPSQSVTGDNTLLSISKIDKRKRGERLSPDWRPSSADFDFAVTLGWSTHQVESEAANFRDYWIARPGSGGCKLDWPATWRKWIRSSNVKPAAPPGNVAPLERDWDHALQRWKAGRGWPRGYGPDPDSPACQCPREIIQKHLGAA